MAFPTTGLLDNFNRANGAAGSNWTGAVWGCGFSFTVDTNQFLANGTFTGSAWSATQFENDCEVYYTLGNVPVGGSFFLALRMSTLDASPNGYRVGIDPATNTWTLQRVTGGSTTDIGTRTQAFASGDSMGLAAIGTALQLWYKAAAGSWTQLGADITDSTYVQRGYIGALAPDGVTSIDNFSGGTVVAPSSYDYSLFPKKQMLGVLS